MGDPSGFSWTSPLTLLMSIPLLMSYNVKYGVFPHGLSYLLFWAWALISVWFVPVLLIVELVQFLRFLKDPTKRRLGGRLQWHLAALCVAIVGEITFLVVRSST